ncbi:MAG TPA: carbonic anhydrase [Acidobacteriaceae bacterium]|jgi:carbonic anhydrase|nr:carbonic anhydrase [Acidobacteriaceae bacterium]
MKRLFDGYTRFRRDVFPGMKEHFHLLADSQAPEFLFITCSDSRVVPDLIFQTEPGDMFLCRTAGNVIPRHGDLPGGVSATIEYAVEVLHVRHIVVCGHSDCGAIKAMIDRRDLTRLPLTAKWLGYIEPAWKYLGPGSRDSEDPRAFHTALIHANVIAQLENLKTHPEVARHLADKTLEVHGWYYDILTGAVEAYDQQQNRFTQLEEWTER